LMRAELGSRSPIRPEELSIVVCGPWLGELTFRSFASLLRHFSPAQFIFSTWEAMPAAPAPFSTVYSLDPGEIGGLSPNSLRVHVASAAGLACTDRPYVLRCRSDLEWRDARILAAGRGPIARDSAFVVFGERIVASGTVTRIVPHSRNTVGPTLHFVSDWLQLGRRADVAALIGDEPPGPDDHLAIEQYWWSTLLRARGFWPAEWSSHGETQPRDPFGLLARYPTDPMDPRGRANLLLANNFYIASPRQLGFRFAKYRFPVHARLISHDRSSARRLEEDCGLRDRPIAIVPSRGALRTLLCALDDSYSIISRARIRSRVRSLARRLSPEKPTPDAR